MYIRSRLYRNLSMKARVAKSLFALAAFFAGGLIYLAYRSETLQMFRWAEAVGASPLVDVLRESANGQNLYEWVKYSLPDGLWLFAYMFIIDSIWNGDKGKTAQSFIYILPVIALLSELSQCFHLLPGVFDLADLASYCGAVLLFWILKIL